MFLSDNTQDFERCAGNNVAAEYLGNWIATLDMVGEMSGASIFVSDWSRSAIDITLIKDKELYIRNH